MSAPSVEQTTEPDIELQMPTGSFGNSDDVGSFQQWVSLFAFVAMTGSMAYCAFHAYQNGIKKTTCLEEVELPVLTGTSGGGGGSAFAKNKVQQRRK